MRSKKTNYKRGYSIREHAIDMFRNYSKIFSEIKTEFDIFPFSEIYYSDNRDCFTHIDKIEISLFISELIKIDYIRLHEKAFNIVVITDKGYEFLNNWNKHLDSIQKY